MVIDRRDQLLAPFYTTEIVAEVLILCLNRGIDTLDAIAPRCQNRRIRPDPLVITQEG
jgi:hypothetical protein